ncbi:pyrrolo-quinoline quinone [Mariprofundus erugo]|nr:pyrrolo-quinoline quinone [Mariprofundus erugo]
MAVMKRTSTTLLLSPLLATVLLASGCSTMNTPEPAAASSEIAKNAAAVLRSAPIELVWRNNLDQRQPASPPGFSLPAVITTPEGDLIIAGAQDNRVRVYRDNGSEQQRISIEAAGESGALQLDNGLVVLGDVAGNLYGLDLKTFAIKWRYALGSALIGRPVAVDHDFIIQAANNQIYRFTANGNKVWSFSGNLGGLGMHLTPSPAVYEDHVYAALSNGDVVAMRAGDGGFLWKRQMVLNNDAAVLSELKVPVASPVVIPAAQSGRDEDLLAVSLFQGELSFLSLQDGSQLRARHLSVKSTPLLIGQRLFVADTAGSVSALDAGSGETRWKLQLSKGELTGPVLSQGMLWLADDQGKVYRIDQEGHLSGQIELSGRIDRAPVATSGGVLVRNNLGVLYMLR